MVNQLGKILRIIRIKKDDSMRDMADKLDISLAYLSAIENGKRNIPTDFEKKVLACYELDDDERKILKEAIDQSTNQVKVNVSELSAKKKKLILALSSGDIDDATIEKMCEIVDLKGN